MRISDWSSDVCSSDLERAAVDAYVSEYAARGVEVERLSGKALAARVPGLRPEWREGAREPTCSDIDVAALHAAYLRAAKRAGADIVLRAPLDRARRRSSEARRVGKACVRTWRIRWTPDQ